MHLLNLILPSIFAMCVVGAPTDFELHSPLAIPVPGSTTYDADLAAAVAYARSHPSSGTVKTSTIAVKQRLCGDYTPGNKPVYSTGLLVCGETDPGVEMKRFTNRMCGFCIVFDSKCGHSFPCC
jgi:hypothetical protein